MSNQTKERLLVGSTVTLALGGAIISGVVMIFGNVQAKEMVMSIHAFLTPIIMALVGMLVQTKNGR